MRATTPHSAKASARADVDGYAERRGDLLAQIQELRARLAQLEVRARHRRIGVRDVSRSSHRHNAIASDQEEAENGR